MRNKTTSQFYHELQLVYDAFNERLFSNELPECLITLQRINKNIGYWFENRFASIDDDTLTHELALNPEFFGTRPLIDIFKVYAHEMCHIRQSLYGTPSKRSYHNAEFASYMLEIGLMMSDTGRPHGKTTGEKMLEYPLPDGKFIKLCNELAEDGKIIRWYDKYAPDNISSIEMIQEQMQIIELVPTASPKLFHIAYLSEDMNQVLKQAIELKQLNEKKTIIQSCSGQSCSGSIENVVCDEINHQDHFDQAISAVVVPEDHQYSPDSIKPTIFIDPADVDEHDPFFKTVNIVHLLSPSEDDEDNLPPVKPKKKTRESFACPGCGRSALSSPTFKLICSDCDAELVLSTTIDAKAIKKMKKQQMEEDVK